MHALRPNVSKQTAVGLLPSTRLNIQALSLYVSHACTHVCVYTWKYGEIRDWTTYIHICSDRRWWTTCICTSLAKKIRLITCMQVCSKINSFNHVHEYPQRIIFIQNASCQRCRLQHTKDVLLSPRCVIQRKLMRIAAYTGTHEHFLWICSSVCLYLVLIAYIPTIDLKNSETSISYACGEA
jgi:hypothetical protein